MNIRIELNETSLVNYYDQLLDELYLLHHIHPSNIPNIDLSPEEIAASNEYDGMARGLAAYSPGTKGNRSKIARFHGDPHYCNGLPRKSRKSR